MFKGLMKRFFKKHDYHEYGGALLLGINGTALICHGASESRTIKNAIMAVKKYHGININGKITEYLSASNIGGEEGQNAEPEEEGLRARDEQ